VNNISLDQSWFEEHFDISDTSATAHTTRLNYILTRLPVTRPSGRAIAPDIHGLATASVSHDDLCTLQTFYIAQGFKDIMLFEVSIDLKRQARNRFICNIIPTPSGPMSRLNALTGSPLHAPVIECTWMNTDSCAGALFDSFPHLRLLLRQSPSFCPHA